MNEQNQLIESFVSQVKVKQKRTAVLFTGVTLISIVVGLAVVGYFSKQVKEKLDQVTLLEKQSAILESKIEVKKNELADKQKELDGVLKAIEKSKANDKTNPEAGVLPVIYTQFKGTIKRELVKELTAMLNEQGFPAPGVENVERIDKPFNNSVRFFYKEDEPLARIVAQKAKSFFESKGCTADFPLVPLLSSTSNAKRGQVEIWISMNCPQ